MNWNDGVTIIHFKMSTEFDNLILLDLPRIDEVNIVEDSFTFADSEDEDELIMDFYFTLQLQLKTQIQQAHGLHQKKKRKRRRLIQRNFKEAHDRIWNDYLCPNPLYTEMQFRRRFRMSSRVFLRIQHDLEQNITFFQRKADCTGKEGLSSLQKITAALRMLAYGEAADRQDEYIKIGERSALQSRKAFCKSIVEIYGEKYLRKPTSQDIARILEVNNRRGFPGLIGWSRLQFGVRFLKWNSNIFSFKGSIDCMHLRWKNCPQAYAGQYQGKEKEPTIVLEAVADESTWIWHSFFGRCFVIILYCDLRLLFGMIICHLMCSCRTSDQALVTSSVLSFNYIINQIDCLLCLTRIDFYPGVPGSNNDINVNDQSPLWSEIATGKFPCGKYFIGTQEMDQYYYTSDNIYPQYPVFIQSFGVSTDPQRSHFSQRLESVRKDVERAFGILQTRFECMKKPCLLWSIEDIRDQVLCCIILHNMILEDEVFYHDEQSIRGTSYLHIPDSTISVVEERVTISHVEELMGNLHKYQQMSKFHLIRDALMIDMYDKKVRRYGK